MCVFEKGKAPFWWRQLRSALLCHLFLLLQRLCWKWGKQISLSHFAHTGSSGCKILQGTFLVGLWKLWVPQTPRLNQKAYNLYPDKILFPWWAGQSGPGGCSPSPGTSPAAPALVGNASQKSPDILSWVSPVHCSNEQLSRHVSILRTVLADNDFDGNTVGLALREADSLWKKKCSQGTDRQINTSPYFTIKQPALDERFPWRSLCWLTASCISSIPSPARLSGGSSPYLREMYRSHRPLRHTVWAPGLLQASLLHMETKVPYQLLGWAGKNGWWQLLVGRERGKKRRGISLNTSIWFLDDLKLLSLCLGPHWP